MSAEQPDTPPEQPKYSPENQPAAPVPEEETTAKPGPPGGHTPFEYTVRLSAIVGRDSIYKPTGQPDAAAWAAKFTRLTPQPDAKQSQPSPSAEESILNDPAHALLEMLRQKDITPQNIGSVRIAAMPELIYAAHRILDRLADAAENTAAVNAARHILEQAVEQRRRGDTFSLEVDHLLTKQEDRHVMDAPDLEAFWGRVARLAEWRPELGQKTVSRLYREWRSMFIRRRQYEQAGQVLRSYGIDPQGSLIPDGFDEMNVRLVQGAVEYRSTDELIAHLRTYFMPRGENFNARIASEDAINRAVDNAPSAVLLPKGEDTEIMERIAEEITTWAAGNAETYTDSYISQGGGDPYKYSNSMFTGHGISVRRVNGRFHLTMFGTGHNMNAYNPTQVIDGFAAFHNKEVTYDDAAEVVYTATPPAVVTVRERNHTVRGVPQKEHAAEVTLPVQAALTRLAELIHLHPLSVKLLGQIISKAGGGGPFKPMQGIRDGSLEIFVIPHYNQLEDATLNTAGEIVGLSPILQDEEDQQAWTAFAVPQLGLSLRIAAGETQTAEQQELNKVLHAVSVVNRYRPRPKHSHGHMDADGLFTLKK